MAKRYWKDACYMNEIDVVLAAIPPPEGHIIVCDRTSCIYDPERVPVYIEARMDLEVAED